MALPCWMMINRLTCTKMVGRKPTYKEKGGFTSTELVYNLYSMIQLSPLNLPVASSQLKFVPSPWWVWYGTPSEKKIKVTSHNFHIQIIYHGIFLHV